MSSEAKVGMFFLTALLLVGVIALYLGDFWVRARSYPVTVYFENVQGLQTGAEARFAGVRIGRVTGVELQESPKFPGSPAAVKIAVFRDVVLYSTDQFAVQQGALLGDKYVDVRRPAATPRNRVGAGAELQGGQGQGIEALTSEVRGLVREARSTLATVRGVFASQYNEQAIRLILANVVGATAKANDLAVRAIQLADILKINAAKAGPNVAVMSANLRDASLSVKNTAALVRHILATSPVPRDAAEASGNIRKATEDLTKISGNLSEVLADPATRKKIEDALDKLHTSTANLAQLTSDAAKLVGDEGGGKDIREALARLRDAATSISKVTGEYEKLLTDPAFMSDVRQTVASAREAAESGSRAMQKAEVSLGQVDQTMAKVNRATRLFSPEDVKLNVGLEGSRDAALRADLKVDIRYSPNRNDFWRLGIRDVADNESLILQRAYPLGNHRLRAGVYGNKAGIGLDVNPHARTSLEAELWDPDHPRLDLRGTYNLSPGTDFLFGFNEVGSGTDPFLGLRYSTNP